MPWVFAVGLGLSLVVRGGAPLVVVSGLLTVVASLVKRGLQGTRASVLAAHGSGVVAPGLSSLVAHGLMGLSALWHVGSSRIRDLTPVSCIGRQILYH